MQEAFISERSLMLPYPYGILEARVLTDALENRQIRFDRLAAIMPSGQLIDTAKNTDLPSLDIGEAMSHVTEGFTVRLAVPVRKDRGRNTVPDEAPVPSRRKELFNVVDQSFYDENTGEDLMDIAVRRINARLLVDGQDDSDLETLPLFKVILDTGDQGFRPRLDPHFAPPCVLLRAWPTLETLIRELANQLSASRNEQIVVMNKGGFNLDAVQGPQIVQMLRLRILNLYTARLRALVNRPASTPWDAYMELAGFMGELAGLRPGSDSFKLPQYEHDRPLDALRRLEKTVRNLLAEPSHENWWELQLEFDIEDRVWNLKLEDKHLDRPNQYFLGVKTQANVESVVALVENGNAFKAMPASLKRRAVFGVKLKYEPRPPLGLPVHNDLHYFRLLQSERESVWDRIKQDKAMCVHWQEMATTDFELSLIMTIPEGG